MDVDLTRLGYRELADRYDLGTLKVGGDFQLTETGDLKILNGDLQIGDIPHNALHRFVVPWRFNAPMLKTAFDFVFVGKAEKAAHEQDVDVIAKRLAAARDSATRAAVVDELHELNDGIGIAAFGQQAYAGAIMVLLHSMLRFEWRNLGKPNRWDSAGTTISGYSVGQIIEAAGNNFRHSDVWLINSMAPTLEQLKSIRPLAAILGVSLAPNPSALAGALGVSRVADGANHPFGKNVCPEVLERLSGGTFGGLMDVVFRYARALAYP